MKNAICKDIDLRDRVEAFREGKRDFSVLELNEIKLYLLKYKDTLSTTQFYTGALQKYAVVSCFTEDFTEQLLSHMIYKLNAAIAIVVVLKDRKVLIRTNKKTCSINLCKLAQLLCDGDCINSKDEIAQGKLTGKFIKFTTKLTPCI